MQQRWRDRDYRSYPSYTLHQMERDGTSARIEARYAH
jgi:hypothetical protein